MLTCNGSNNQKGHQGAPYCIKMQLTLDYGKRAKGQPEVPKAQRPYHCTGRRPCEQICQQHPKGTRFPIPQQRGRQPGGHLHYHTRDQSAEPRRSKAGVLGASRKATYRLASPPYCKIFEGKPTEHAKMRSRTFPTRLTGRKRPRNRKVKCPLTISAHSGSVPLLRRSIRIVFFSVPPPRPLDTDEKSGLLAKNGVLFVVAFRYLCLSVFVLYLCFFFR